MTESNSETNYKNENDIGALLVMHRVSKSFPGVKALDAVDFSLRPGEIHALMGENGAGKSTLIKILTGAYRRDSGQITFDGRRIDPHSPLEAQKIGISAVFQEVNLIPDLSVAENIYLGREPMKTGRIDWKRVRGGAEAAMRRLDVSVDVSQPLRSYSIAIQQLTAIARAIDVEARVLVLDEPTSSLATHEVEKLFAVMRKLRDEGLGIVFITHFLDQVYAISDRLTVLRNGKLVGEYEAALLPRLQLISLMLGRDAQEIEKTSAAHGDSATPAGTPFLKAEGLAGGAVKPFSLEIRAGEILGIAGLLGAGRTEAAQLLFGIDRASEGTIEIEGMPVKLTSPMRAIEKGIGFCPEDRRSAGIIPNLSVRENIIAALQARRGWLRRLPLKKQRELADNYIRALNIATTDAEKPVGHLSGGNQQKVILARWLALQPKLLILDEPTRGIDVGTKAEIEKRIAALCAEGMAAVFISSELEEVARDSHRVAVMREGAKIGELFGSQICLPAIIRMIAEIET
jgi:simple sugar transport system ATP-binding protein